VNITLDSAVFHDYLIFRREEEYSLYNEKKTAVYYVVLFDFVKTVNDDTKIVRGMELGYTENRDFKLAIFCDTMEPCLVINDPAPPLYYDNRYWFSGGFLFSNGSTDWLSFTPVDDFSASLTDMAEHQVETPGLNYYPYFRIRFKTSLTSLSTQINAQRERACRFL
jgi:hypothetical protein